MKKLLIILFSIIFVVSAGLLTYGALQGPKRTETIEEVDMVAPPSGLFLGEFADEKIDMSAIASSKNSKDLKVAEMLVNASYNNIMIDCFYYKAHVDVQSVNSDDYACSDYFRAKSGVNMFYQTLAYTGLINPVNARVDYVNQRIESTDSSAEYDIDTKVWSYTMKAGKAKQKEQGLPALNPYNIYSWYDFPLDLGGTKVASGNTAGRTEAISGAMIDASSVKIETMGGANPYYKISFTALIDKANQSEETLYRFSDSCAKIKNAVIHELSFVVEIWKNEGVFRSIAFDADADGSLNGKKGRVEIKKKLEFSYDAKDASVAWQIKRFADRFDPKWMTNWSSENQAKLAEDLAKLPAEKTEETEE